MVTTAELLTPLRNTSDRVRLTTTLRQAAEAQQDFVIPINRVRASTADRGELVTTWMGDSSDPFILHDGVSSVIVADTTHSAQRHLASKLGIPTQYLDKLLTSENHSIRQLGAYNINELSASDDRRMLARFWNTDDGIVLRALLSDRYQAIDNYAAFAAIVQAMQEADMGLAECEVTADLTPDRFRLRIAVPQIELAVPDLLGDYRMPFSMRDGNDVHARPEAGERPPVLWAGIEVANSETGGGAFSIAPRAVVEVCRNGMTRPVEFRRTHIGAQLSEGSVNWSDDTRRAALELVKSQVRDSVKAFLSTDYLHTVADEMRRAKGVAVESSVDAIELVSKSFSFSETEHNDILDCFIRSGDMTVLGIGQAVTAAAQLAPEGDRQTEMETAFWGIVKTPERFVGAS